MPSLLESIHHLPILTTLLSAIFFVVLVKAYRERHSGPHLLWWAAGVFCYGAGTLVESLITLNGNSIVLNKAWYVTGALLGGYPLAQGVVYLLLKRKTANILAGITLPIIVVGSVLTLLSPVDLTHFQTTRPTGAILEWSWIRWGITPWINLYAFAFLVGGAILSVVRYRKRGEAVEKIYGNTLIAVGGILPGIGGGMAATGLVEALYIGELIGLILIWSGYALIAGMKRSSAKGTLPVGGT